MLHNKKGKQKSCTHASTNTFTQSLQVTFSTQRNTIYCGCETLQAPVTDRLMYTEYLVHINQAQTLTPSIAGVAALQRPGHPHSAVYPGDDSTACGEDWSSSLCRLPSHPALGISVRTRLLQCNSQNSSSFWDMHMLSDKTASVRHFLLIILSLYYTFCPILHM